MKIQCDVCGNGEASVYCVADEAALCDSCDHRVHHANKLASKHHRFSLLHPSSKDYPVCDICQEKKGFIFCQQDRAILCRDCDLPLHRANEHTQKHNRFLLTGIKLSANSTLYSPSTVSETNDSAASARVIKKPISVANPPLMAKTSNPIPLTTNIAPCMNKIMDSMIASENTGSISSISEYLIETLPGYHVEDLLDSSYSPFGFCKGNDERLPFMDSEFDSHIGCFPSSESFGVWVPQASPPMYSYPSSQIGGHVVLNETKGNAGMKGNNNSNRRWRDDCFTVPEITPPSTGFKRSRPLW